MIAKRDSNVMFICTFDPFGLGLSQYTFCETCEEDHELKLNDGAEKIFYNYTYAGEDIPDNLREFYDYVENGKAGNELTKRIDEAVVKSRKNSIWRSQYMKEKIVLFPTTMSARSWKNSGRTRGRFFDMKPVLWDCLI